ERGNERRGAWESGVTAFADARAAVTQAHEAFLRFSAGTSRAVADVLTFQNALLEQWVTEPAGLDRSPRRLGSRRNDVFLDREQCLAFAVGQVAPVLGPEFAAVDEFPTRVRLPDEPL